MPMTVMTADEKLHKAKIKLQEMHPFFAYLIMHMKGTEDERCPTMGVDKHGNMVYNKQYVESLSDSLLRSCLAHEVTHVILSHIVRYHRDWSPQLGNIAADIISNDLLDTEGFELDSNWIVPHNHEYNFQGKKGRVIIDEIDNKSMEEIYHILEKHVDMQESPSCSACAGTGKSSGGDGEGGDDGDDGDGEGQCPHCNGSGTDAQGQVNGMPGKSQDQHRYDDSEAEGMYDKEDELPEEWKFKLAEAAAVAKQRGKLSGRLGELVGHMIEAKVDWRSQLLKYINSMLPYDFTWSRPSRRSASLGIYMPAVLKEQLEVVVHIDSSGSIGSDTIREFMGEVRGILQGFTAVEMTLIICDAQIHQVYELTPDNIPELEELAIGGRGGTSHSPVVDWINENQSTTRIFISLTDGYSDIQHCYERLPMNTERLILLDSGSGEMQEEMGKYGQVIWLGNA